MELPPGHKRARRPPNHRNKFLDIEAVVDGESDEDAEDESHEVQDVDTDDHNVIEHISVLSRLNLEKEMNRHDLTVARIMAQYVGWKSIQPGREYDPHLGEIAKFERLTADLNPELRERLRAHTLLSIPPSEDDWETWEVPVFFGKEELAVCDILLAAEHGGVHRRCTPPRSAFAPPGLSGRIYLEARTKLNAITVCKPLQGVRWWETQFVTRKDAMKLLNQRPAPFTPHPNMWICLARQPYVNDLAFVKEVLNWDFLRVIVIPRMRYYRAGDFTQHFKRPVASPFKLERALTISGPQSLKTIGSGLMAQHLYFNIHYDFNCPLDSYSSYDTSGFLDLVVSSSEYLEVDVYPQLSDVTPFMNCVSIPHEFKLLTIRLAENQKLRNGDQVLVIPTGLSGNTNSDRHAGRVGVIVDISNTTAYITFASPNFQEAVQIPLTSIHRHFRVGDYIRVKAGDSQGRVGWVTCINDVEEQITIMTPKFRQNLDQQVFDMGNFELSIYENLPVTVLVGPLKGRSGMVKTISLRQKAKVELRGSHAVRNQLEELSIRDLAFELELYRWYRLRVKTSEDFNHVLGVELEAIPINTIPTSCSMLAVVSERRFTTPEPEPNLSMHEDPLSANFIMERTPQGTVPDTCWLMKLPYRDKFSMLKLSIQSHGSYGSGKWDGCVGFYKGLSGDKVNFFSKESGHLRVPFYYINPVNPTKAPQNAHCLAIGQDLSKRFKVQKFGEQECEVVPFSGGREGSTRKIATVDLAVGFHRLPSKHCLLLSLTCLLMTAKKRALDGVHIVYDSTCPSKLAKQRHSPDEPSIVVTLMEDEPAIEIHNDIPLLDKAGDEMKPEKKKQNMSTKLAAFSSKIMQDIQEELLALEVEIGASHSLKTVFTFSILEDFHRHSLSAKVSAYDYFDALRRHTNAAFPHLVQNRYNEFRLAMRLWCTLALRRRSGQEHNIDLVLTHRRFGSLAVRCFTCPEVGFNVEEWVLELSSEDKIHIYTLYVSADGNFRLQRKRKNDDPNDKGLNGGNAYFVNDDSFHEYLESQGLSVKDITLLCSKLKAVRQQDRSKFKDAIISGVVAIQCARHGLYLPQAMVDLTKGESFVKTDYALFSGLGIEGLRQERIVISYDVWCQYHKNLKTHLTNQFSEFLPLLERDRITGAVPKMHINGHKSDCQINYSFIYEPHSGMTCGEGIESAWSEQNHAAAFTKEQNPGHRHDTLDDFNGYWNWMKLQRLPAFLRQQRTKWKSFYDKRLESFSQFSMTISTDLLQSWRSMKYPAYTKSSLYEIQGKMPSRQKIFTALVEQEQKTTLTGVTEFIQHGLELESLQSSIIRASNKDIDHDRTLLLGMLRNWRVSQLELFPSIPSPLSIDEDAPEHTPLFLPSSFSLEERHQFLLKEATETERQLRRGLAYDLLQSVRDSIHEYYYLVTEKGINPSSQRIGTRNQKLLYGLVSEQESMIDQYMDSFQKLKEMGMAEDDELEPLQKDQLWGKNVFLPHKLGDSTKDFPWFWFVGRSDEYSQDAWLIELDRVRWFRERAAVERLKEELEILEEEFRRVHTSFSRMNEVWTTLAKNSKSAGFASYALRQAHMHASFAREAWTAWKDQ
ncbi:hypothetical protein NP233_g6404 [Leucocoprinus birnbaumii]|uniref:KOW domain-containing protein n=1 Tax=Leucocoprinus birnbaumii TaxID=56174 RepID=A0AAD5VR36_9AGAR|nr:hypothetical protein NP233_g6404 [Leucocoprinus birnbaumii]